ncbi:MAG: zinc ribbon domain-containing protein [Actinomycetota bacterium]
MPEATPGLVRCPRCGAGNPSDAEWCGQCLERFGAADADASDISVARPEVSRAGELLTWTCPACDSPNPMDAETCARCGSAFTSFFARPEKVAVRPVPSGRAVALSAALPGLGHWSLGRAGAGVARVVLYLWTLGLSILLLTRPPAAGRAVVRMVGIAFVLSAAGVWLVSMLETMRLADGDERPVLPPHALTWLSAALSALLIFGLLGSALAGRGAP